MRVAHVIYGLGLGGLEQLVLRLCARSQEKGISSAIFALGPDGPVGDLAKAGGIPVFRIPGEGLSPTTIAALRHAVSEFGAQVIHAHDVGPWLNAAAAKVLMPRARLFATIHEQRMPPRKLQVMARAACLVTSSIVACGESVRSDLSSWLPRRVALTVIPNGIPLGLRMLARQEARQLLGLPPDAVVVGFVGGLREVKGPHLLLDAFLQRFGGRNDVHLCLVGTGPLETRLRQQAASAGNVHLPGLVANGSRLLPAFDIYAQPSLSEGRSLSMLEAMVAGLPTLGHAIASVKEIHESERTAVLVELGDRTALAQALGRLIDDEGLRHRLGAEARQRVVQFGLEPMVDAYHRLYGVRPEVHPPGPPGTVRVLHVRQGRGFYGAERAIANLTELLPRPFESTVAFLVPPGERAPLADDDRARGMSISIPTTARLDLRCARLLAEEARRSDARLLHAHDFKSLFVAIVAGWRVGVPVVATFHGDTAVNLRARLYEAMAKALGNLIACAIAVSRPLERRLSRWMFRGRVEFIPNGVRDEGPIEPDARAAARARLGLSQSELVLAVIGRLSPEKGHSVLLAALKRCRTRPMLLICGDGPLRADLEAMAGGLNVRFLGFQKDVRSVMAAADAVVLPSLREGFPLVALEAASAGRCVIASSVGELPLALAGCCAFVPPGDQDALADAIDRIASPDLRRKLSVDATQMALRYRADATAARYAEVYGQVLRLQPRADPSLAAAGVR